MCLLSVVDSLVAHTMWNWCNNSDILEDCHVVNYMGSHTVALNMSCPCTEISA